MQRKRVVHTHILRYKRDLPLQILQISMREVEVYFVGSIIVSTYKQAGHLSSFIKVPIL